MKRTYRFASPTGTVAALSLPGGRFLEVWVGPEEPDSDLYRSLGTSPFSTMKSAKRRATSSFPSMEKWTPSR